jgi:hypothetical protein
VGLTRPRDPPQLGPQLRHLFLKPPQALVEIGVVGVRTRAGAFVGRRRSRAWRIGRGIFAQRVLETLFLLSGAARQADRVAPLDQHIQHLLGV